MKFSTNSLPGTLVSVIYGCQRSPPVIPSTYDQRIVGTGDVYLDSELLWKRDSYVLPILPSFDRECLLQSLHCMLAVWGDIICLLVQGSQINRSHICGLDLNNKTQVLSWWKDLEMERFGGELGVFCIWRAVNCCGQGTHSGRLFPRMLMPPIRAKVHFLSLWIWTNFVICINQ